ncbi:MAG: DnaJ domain-containing protein [Cyclobacteriaceae bacterium]
MQPDSIAEEIKKAYHQLVVKYHPDKNQGDQQSETVFKVITALYEVLSDSESRNSYDYEFNKATH